ALPLAGHDAGPYRVCLIPAPETSNHANNVGFLTAISTHFSTDSSVCLLDCVPMWESSCLDTSLDLDLRPTDGYREQRPGGACCQPCVACWPSGGVGTVRTSRRWGVAAGCLVLCATGTGLAPARRAVAHNASARQTPREARPRKSATCGCQSLPA